MSGEKRFFSKNIKEINDIEGPVCDYAKLRGWLVQKLASQSANGWPDRFFARKGRLLFVEFKAPGERPTVQQMKRHREMQEQGIEVHVIDSLEAGFGLLR